MLSMRQCVAGTCYGDPATAVLRSSPPAGIYDGKTEDGQPGTVGCTNLVSYMSPRIRTSKSPKFLTHCSLLIATESPLSRPLGCSEKHTVNCLASNSAGYSPRHPERSKGSYSDDNPTSYRADHLPENLVSSREDCPDSDSADPSADCPYNHPAGNSERNLPGNWANNLSGYSESSSMNSLLDYLENDQPRPQCSSQPRR